MSTTTEKQIEKNLSTQSSTTQETTHLDSSKMSGLTSHILSYTARFLKRGKARILSTSLLVSPVITVSQSIYLKCKTDALSRPDGCFRCRPGVNHSTFCCLPRSDTLHSVGYIGQIKKCKLLGGLAVNDGDETDWKMMVIDVADSLAPLVNCKQCSLALITL